MTSSQLSVRRPTHAAYPRSCHATGSYARGSAPAVTAQRLHDEQVMQLVPLLRKVNLSQLGCNKGREGQWGVRPGRHCWICVDAARADGIMRGVTCPPPAQGLVQVKTGHVAEVGHPGDRLEEPVTGSTTTLHSVLRHQQLKVHPAPRGTTAYVPKAGRSGHGRRLGRALLFVRPLAAGRGVS